MERRDQVPFDARYFEKRASQGKSTSADEVFRDIYLRRHWGANASPSGAGTSDNQTRTIRLAIPSLVAELGCRTVLDVPCGDYTWMRQVDLGEVAYIGGDLLPELIVPLQALHSDARHQFLVLDVMNDSLPQADLLLCRDCLVHLSLADAGRALRNIRRSAVRYLLTTTFPECANNQDIVTGDWRPINLELGPFNLPPPARLLTEECTESGGIFADKSLGLWDLTTFEMD
jgi:hypothetical protein